MFFTGTLRGRGSVFVLLYGSENRRAEGLLSDVRAARGFWGRNRPRAAAHVLHPCTHVTYKLVIPLSFLECGYLFKAIYIVRVCECVCIFIKQDSTTWTVCGLPNSMLVVT